MSKEARSKGACWTCRLRRKKCDEALPLCSACTSLAVPCFGYDKPAWADGGDRQRAKAEELQVMIRELASLRRTRKRRVAPTANDLVTVEENKGVVHGLEASDARSMEMEQLGRNGPASIGSQRNEQPLQGLTAPGELTALSLSERSTNGRNITSNFLEYDSQADLLMHYLDVVFPNQFPFYDPSPSEGGRGWLLLIIMRTKPLYHAALSMAAYHQQYRRGWGCHLSNVGTKIIDMLQTQHSLAIKELRHHLDTFRQEERAKSLEGSIEVLACIVFLISLEVFLGDTRSWPMHLRAAQTILPGLGKGCSKSLVPHEPLSPSHQKALRFFTGVIAWYDISSSATTGSKQWAPRFCLDPDLALVNFNNLETVIGCENSVILTIIEIIELMAWKSTEQKSGSLDACELIARASPFEQHLEKVIDRHSTEIGELTVSASLNWDELLNSESVALNEQSHNTSFLEAVSRHANISAITRIFACAALVYLNVVVYGSLAEHPKIRGSVCRTIGALKELRDRSMLGMLTWPLCIAGSMATGWKMDFFTELSNELEEVSNVKLGNLKRCAKIMEECWRLRKEAPEGTVGIDWLDAMKSLDMKILLI